MRHPWTLPALLLASLLALVVTACETVGPDYEKPQLPADERASWNGRLDGVLTDEELDPDVMARWWTTLGDPVLVELVDMAADANLDLRQADAQLSQARAQRGVAEAQGLPSVTASAGAERARTGGRTESSAAAGLDASWELDVFGRIERIIEAAEADLAAAEEARRDVLVSVMGEVALNYVDLRTLQRQLRITRDNLVNQEAVLELTQVREAAGEASQVDVDRATAEVASTRAQIPMIEQFLDRIENRLAVLAGRSPGELDAFLAGDGGLPVPPARVAVGVPAEALRRRPDVRRAERQLAAETARVGVAIAELYPTFSLGGSVGMESRDGFDNSRSTFGIGPRMQWNLFEGGAIRQRIAVQNAVQEEALVNYERAVLVALEDVENAITAFTQEQLRYAELLVASEAAASAARLAEARYEAGETGFLEVLDAQRTRLSAESSCAMSEAMIVTNVVRLYKALGGGWENVPPLPEGEAPGDADG